MCHCLHCSFGIYPLLVFPFHQIHIVCQSSSCKRPNKSASHQITYIVILVKCTDTLLVSETIVPYRHHGFFFATLNSSILQALQESVQQQPTTNTVTMYMIPEDDFDSGIKHAMLHSDLSQIYLMSKAKGNLILPDGDREKIIRKYSCSHSAARFERQTWTWIRLISVAVQRKIVSVKVHSLRYDIVLQRKFMINFIFQITFRIQFPSHGSMYNFTLRTSRR